MTTTLKRDNRPSSVAFQMACVENIRLPADRRGSQSEDLVGKPLVKENKGAYHVEKAKTESGVRY